MIKKVKSTRQKFDKLKKQDTILYNILQAEQQRQADSLELIPSENIVSKAVLEAMGSILTNKYSEGYPGARYYGGNEQIDKIENLARDRLKKLFNVPYANVQPYSGSQANMAVYIATCEAGDTVLGQHLFDGGHLTHGWKMSSTAKFFNTIQYHVKEDGYIDLDEVKKLAKKHKPKLIWVGATAYVREFPFKELGEIANEVGAYLVADVAHIAGLIVAGAHASPEKFVDIITSTTHKTLRGPRGGVIMVTKKGLKKDKDLGLKLDRAIMPGSQGGPHNHTTAAMAVAFAEAAKPAFKKYGKQVVKNADALAKALIKGGAELVSSGTDNHLLLLKCGKGRGAIVETALDLVGLTANKNTIPNEPSSPFYPSGVRMGTPSITTRGMKVNEMKLIAKWINQVIETIKDEELPDGKVSEKKKYITKLAKRLSENTEMIKIRKSVQKLCKEFPAPDSLV
ncbi:MAG: serine hydroxymethyltransferase [Candidatus Pacebacteria bacterium]|nr:serine hydroxymethyltransferase [Candidatus Paceibacterota bacterium]